MTAIENTKYITETVLLGMSPVFLPVALVFFGFWISERRTGVIVAPKAATVSAVFAFLFVFSVGFWLSDEYSRTKLDAKTIERIAAIDVSDIDTKKLTDVSAYTPENKTKTLEFEWVGGNKSQREGLEDCVDIWINYEHVEPFKKYAEYWYEKLYDREFSNRTQKYILVLVLTCVLKEIMK